VPEAGDVIWVDLNPTKGIEQAGHRPALILSPSSYNAKTGLCIACAMTRKIKGYPFEVAMPNGSVILADQLRCIDWRFRNGRLKEKAPAAVLGKVRVLVATLLQL
jgi:mRNA interferase MazF